MKIILKYIITNLKERRLRTAVMLLSIFLSAMLLFVSFSIGASYESAQRKMARGMAGSAAVSVSSPDGSVTSDDIPDLSSIGAAVGILKGAALYHENGYYETIDLIAADLSSLNKINPPRLTDGGEISGFEGNRILLPDRFTSKYGIQKGDDFTLLIEGSPVTFEVAGIAAYDTVFLRHTRGATALLPVKTLAGLTGQTDGYHEILTAPADGVSADLLKEELSAALPDGLLVTETVNEAQIAADARQKSMPFFLISFFSLTMSVFIIYSSYKVITLDRLPIIGTFRSIGAAQKTVTRILLAESMLYGMLGGLIGIPAGAAILRLILQGMGQSLSQGIEIPVIISPAGILSAFAVAVLVSLLSAWLPIRRASRLPVKEVVLGTVKEARSSHRLTAPGGALLFVISILLPRAVTEELLYPAGGFSLLGLIASAILFVPFFTNLCARGMEHVYGVFLGNEGRLAARNMRDNRNTTQNITLLFISISAIIAIQTVGDFVTAYVGDVFNGAELEGFADGPMDSAFVEQVQNMEGMEKLLPLYVFKNSIRAGKPEDTEQENSIILTRLEGCDNPDWYFSMFALHFTKEKPPEISLFQSERTVLLSESCMERGGFSTGDTITLTDGNSSYNYIIAGSFKSRATDVEAVISSQWAEADFGASSYGFLAYTASDPEAVMVQIRSLFGDISNWSRTVEEFNTDALTTVGAFLQPMHSMTYFILLLAAAGVVNNLLINYMQKRRITAMYKSAGLSNRQNMKMTLIEGFSSGLIGAVIAIAISFLEIQTIFLVAGPKISMSPNLEASAFLRAGLMGIGITLLGSAVPILKNRRMKLVEEIKFE